jgi:hypothetical protein
MVTDAFDWPDWRPPPELELPVVPEPAEQAVVSRATAAKRAAAVLRCRVLIVSPSL